MLHLSQRRLRQRAKRLRFGVSARTGCARWEREHASPRAGWTAARAGEQCARPFRGARPRPRNLRPRKASVPIAERLARPSVSGQRRNIRRLRSYSSAMPRATASASCVPEPEPGMLGNRATHDDADAARAPAAARYRRAKSAARSRSAPPRCTLPSAPAPRAATARRSPRQCRQTGGQASRAGRACRSAGARAPRCGRRYRAFADAVAAIAASLFSM